MTRPKNARDQWNRLVELGATADIDDVADMSEAEVDAALAKAGFDVAEENRQGKAEHDAAVRASAKRAKPVGLRSRARVWLAAPAAALVTAGSLLVIGESAVVVGNGNADAGTVPPADAGARLDGGESGSAK